MSNSVATSGIHAELGAYSHGVLARGSVLHISGQVPVDVNNRLVGDDVTVQAEQVFANVAAVVRSAGADLDAVVKLTTFLVDAGDAAAVGRVRRNCFSSAYPASSVVVVAGLLVAEWRLEVEAVAVL